MANIPHYSAKKKLTTKELRDFRSYVSQLKSKGLIPKSTDAKTARPYFIRGGKTLAESVNKYHNELTPKPELVKLGKPGISIVDFPPPATLKHKSLAGILNEIETRGPELDKLKKPDESWAFSIHGTRGYVTFKKINLFAEFMKESAGIQQVLHKRQKSQNIVEGLKLVRWNKTPGQFKGEMQHYKKPKSKASKQARHRRRSK
jgi:hypothetical protein